MTCSTCLNDADADVVATRNGTDAGNGNTNGDGHHEGEDACNIANAKDKSNANGKEHVGVDGNNSGVGGVTDVGADAPDDDNTDGGGNCPAFVVTRCIFAATIDNGIFANTCSEYADSDADGGTTTINTNTTAPNPEPCR